MRSRSPIYSHPTVILILTVKDVPKEEEEVLTTLDEARIARQGCDKEAQ